MRLNHRIYDALERILLVVLYFVPYAYMALLADVRGGTVVGYILCAVIMGFIAFLAGITDHRTLALGGLLLSTLSSLSITVRYDNDWSRYTKPLYPSGVVLVIMAAMLAVHILVWKLMKKKS